jgi:RHS repeat-associated protein
MICQINLFTGHVTQAALDFAIPGWAPVRLERLYTSSSTYTGPMGRGWIHSYDVELWRERERLIYRDASGSRTSFEAASGFVSGARTLEVLPDRVVMHDQAGGRQAFILLGGAGDSYRLVLSEDAYGNTLRFQHVVSGVSSILDDIGRRVEFTYTDTGHVSEISLVTHAAPATRVTLARYEYEPADRLARVFDRLGVVASYEYTGGQLVCERDANGFGQYLEYDAQGRCVGTWYEGGRRAQEIWYDRVRRTTLVTNSLGHRTLYRFNDAGAVTEVIDALGASRRRSYDSRNRLLMVVGPADRPLAASVYDQPTRTLTEMDASGAQTVTVYGAMGLPVSITNVLGQTRHHEFGRGERLTLVRSPAGRTWQYEYDSHGALCRVTCPDAYVLYREVSEDFLTIVIRDDWGPLERRRYDVHGNLKEREEASELLEELEYDARHRLVSHRQGGGSPTRYTYDSKDNVTSLINPLGHVMRFVYDPCDALISQTDPAGYTITYHLDSEERLIGVVNELGERASIEYDAAGRMVRSTMFDGRIDEVAYDESGRRVRITDAGGAGWTALEYGQNALTTRRRFSDGTDELYTFDPLGRLLTFQSPTCRLEYDRDADGRVVREVQPHCAIEYEYDRSGLLSVVRDTFEREVRFEHTPRRRLVRIVDSGQTYDISLNPSGQLITAIRVPGGLRQEFAYDSAERMIARRVLGPDARELARRLYTYDANDRLIAMSDSRLGQFQFTFDSRGKITAVLKNGVVTETYTYDACGNLTGTPMHGAVTLGRGNRVLAAGPYRYEYNALGQLVTQRVRDAVTRFSYSPDGQLRRAELPDGDTWEYEYDAFGRRTAKRHGSATVAFCWDRNLLRAELRLVDGVPAERVDYLFIPGTSVPLSIRRGGQASHVSFDQIGTPTEMWDEEGTLLWSMSAEAFGARRREEGASDNPFHFQGQYVDRETGLHYNRFRSYDPTLARFTTPDPLGLATGLNLYVYPSNPFNWIDPLGLAGPTLQLECRSEWNPCEQYAAQMKVKAINKHSKRQQLQRTDPCRTNQRDYYKRKCADPEHPGSTHDIDHMLELQLGGFDQCCTNLWEMPRSPNRSLGSQIKSEMDKLDLDIGDNVGGLAISGCNKARSCTPKPTPPDPTSGCEEGD